MALVQGQDGELRITEHGLSGTTYYLEVLFTGMDFSGPIARPYPEETLIMNRNKFDTGAHYIEGSDAPRYEPIPITFSCRKAGTTDTIALHNWLSGSTSIPNAAGGTSTIYSRKGLTTIDGNTLPSFAGSGKNAYRVEIIWAGKGTSGVSYGLRYDEVYFPPDQQTIAEAENEVVLSCNGQVYGGVTRIRDFTSGTSQFV